MLPTDIHLEITTHLIHLESLYFDQSLIKNNPLIDILLLNNKICIVLLTTFKGQPGLPQCIHLTTLKSYPIKTQSR